MKKHLSTFAATLVLMACGQSGDVENAIKGVLRDPNSVIFEKVLISEDVDIACAIWNSKNGFGGYGDKQISELRKINGKWSISKEEISPEICNEEFYKVRDELRNLNKKILASSKVSEETKKIVKQNMEMEFESPVLMRQLLESTKIFAKLL